MNSKTKWIVLLTSLTALLLLAVATVYAGSPGQDSQPPDAGDAQAAPNAPLGTAFTYQGKLEGSSGPISATCTIAFRLYDQAASGAQVGSPLTRTVSIDNGLFTESLDFGASAFDGQARWLGILVKCPGDTAFTDMGRQALTAAPYALYALKAPWSGLTGVPAGFADGVDNNTTYSAGAGLSLVGTTFSADTAYLQRRVSGTCGAGNAIRVVNADGTVTCEPDDDTTYAAGTGLSLAGTTFSADTAYLQRRVSGTCTTGNAIRVVNADGTVTCEPITGVGASWLLTGNAGTTPGTHFLGTTDAISLTLAVSGTAALRLEPNEGAPNLIGGYSGNSVTDGAYGATISGGGTGGDTNRVTDDFGTVGGGANNRAGDNAGVTNDAPYTTVSGGRGNTASSSYTTVGGGYYNAADGTHATIGGGYLNATDSTYATVGGGASNEASGYSATVGGGFSNEASNYYVTIGGGYDNTANDWSATIGGGYSNEASNYYTTVGGGYYNTAGDYAATVGGGYGNTANARFAAIAGGGRSNPGDSATGNRVTDDYGTVGGGGDNQAGDNAGTANDATYATVGGGHSNTASGDHTTIGGGLGNEASGDHTTIGGGHLNNADGEYVFIGGGESNDADGSHATIGGGSVNDAGGNYATVSGGQSNTASGNYATVGGGGHNTASGLAAVVAGGGGYSSGAITNTASGNWSTIGGGAWNTASGAGSTIPGGNTCTAQGTNSFAAGTHAKANHQGAFVWSDHVYTDFASERDNQFRVRASGGARFDVNSFGWVNVWDDGTNLVNTSTGARLTVGGTWTNSSDRDRKENFAAMDGQEVLARLAEVPITTWNYKAEDVAIRHMGPVAQDFYAAFGLGSDDTSIATVDADGVALAAIQGLYEQNRALEQENASLQAENAAQQAQIDDLEARLAALEHSDAPGASQSGLPLGALLLLGGLALAAGAVVQRRRSGGGR